MLEPRREEDKIAVVIAGKMYAGKSSVGKLLIDLLPTKSVEVSPCAGRLKELVHDYYGITQEEANRIKEEIRPDYQQLGTEAIRNNYKDDFHALVALRKKSKILIIDDVRYSNELYTIKKYCGGVISVWVDAYEDDRKARCEKLHGAGSFKNNNHSSENSLNGSEGFWDYKILNNIDGIYMLNWQVEPIAAKLNKMLVEVV